MEKLHFQAKMFRLFRVRVGTSAQAQKVQNTSLARELLSMDAWYFG